MVLEDPENAAALYRRHGLLPKIPTGFSRTYQQKSIIRCAQAHLRAYKEKEVNGPLEQPGCAQDHHQSLPCLHADSEHFFARVHTYTEKEVNPLSSLASDMRSRSAAKKCD